MIITQQSSLQFTGLFPSKEKKDKSSDIKKAT